MKQSISLRLSDHLASKPAADTELGFGQIFTDHMFTMDYSSTSGWHNPQIIPYTPLEFDPSTIFLHYGQAVFDGLKAYRTPDGSINLFRPKLHLERINASSRRMVIPPIDPDFVLNCLKELLRIEQDWVPDRPGCSLYIRPFIIAMDPCLIVQPSRTYRFYIILTPSGSYYPQGMNPISIYVETEYVRAVKGGSGQVKTPSNYAASLIAQNKAKAAGCVQVLWLDGVQRRYIEEIGSMNAFFVIDGKLVTPELNGSILPGITRRSVLELARDSGFVCEERQIAVEELFDLAKQGRVSEMFGSGTAAVISPVGELRCQSERIIFNQGKIGKVTQHFYDRITGIQYGLIPDQNGWTEKI